MQVTFDCTAFDASIINIQDDYRYMKRSGTYLHKKCCNDENIFYQTINFTDGPSMLCFSEEDAKNDIASYVGEDPEEFGESECEIEQHKMTIFEYCNLNEFDWL